MESAPKEHERLDGMPFYKQMPIKEEPHEMSMSFIYPNGRAVDQGRSGEQPQNLVLPPFPRPYDAAMVHGYLPAVEGSTRIVEGNARMDLVNLTTQNQVNQYITPNARLPENSSSLMSLPRTSNPDLALPVGTSSSSLPEHSEVLGSLNLCKASGDATSSLLSSSSSLEKEIGMKGSEANKPESVLNCVDMPLEELSPSEQLSVTSDVVFAHNASGGAKQSKEDTTPQSNSDPPTSDDTGSRRMKRKVGEYKRTIQTRSQSGSLPKACRIRGPSKLKSDVLLEGCGVKKFNCLVCEKSFSHMHHLKRHVFDIHDGRPVPKYIPPRVTDPITFLCPLCEIPYSRKYHLKRHFAGKHENVTKIPCPECHFKAKKLQDYLRHIEKHKPVAQQQPESEEDELKCHECYQLFESSDALGLHVLDHKIEACLSRSDTHVSQEVISNCIQPSSESKSPISSEKGDVHLPPASSTKEANSSLHSRIPQELKLVAEKSLSTISKLTARLDALSRKINADWSSPSSSDPLPAMNHISSLSTELTNLSTTLGHALLCQGQQGKVKIEAEAPESLEDPVTDSNLTDDDPEEKNGEVSHEEDGDFEMAGSGQDNEEEKAKAEDQSTPPKVPKLRIRCPTSRRRKGGKVGRGRKKKVSVCNVDESQEHSHICKQCGKVFSDCGGLKRHMMIHKDVRPYQCKVCKMAFRRREHLKKHMAKHSEDRPYKCDKCHYAAKTAQTLHTHALTHGEDRLVACKICSFRGRTAYELTKHEKKHTPCALCGYIAADSADFKMHKRSHLSYSCTECNYSCYTSWQLRRHSKVHNPPSEDREKFCCELCGYSCVEKRQFTYHMERHENKTPYSCPECDYKCSSRSSIDAHKLMHAGLRPYLCSICGASFRRTSHLNNHMLIHKEEKKHVCRTCGRPFRARHNLRQHEMIHTGQKNFKCHLCSFACRRNKELRLHIAKHVILTGGIDAAARPSGSKDLRPMDETQ